MTLIYRAALTALAIAALAFALCHTLDPTVDQAAQWLVYAAAPPVTVFVVLYGFTTPWWTTWIGRALLVSSIGFALLLDLSAAYQLLGADYLGRAAVRLTVLSIVCAGAWLKLIALLVEKRRGHQRRSQRGLR